VRRLARILLNAVTMLSLLLFAAAVVLWIESASRSEWSPRSHTSGSGINVTFYRDEACVHIGPYNRDGGMTWRAAYWKMLLVTGLAPALWLSQSRRRGLSGTSGLCPKCGYDLRATLERCPECGALAESPI
jgi:hypothetical protein